MKKILSVAVVIFVLVPALLTAQTIHVPGDYPTIQQAVDAANNGYLILVDDGFWEGASIQNLSITIRSENGPEQCFIDSSGGGFTCSSASPTIDGFTISGDSVGIWSEGGSLVVTDCVITDNWAGGIQSHYTNTTISDCEISSNVNTQIGGGGIHAWGSFTVSNCLFHQNATVYDPQFGFYGGEGGAIWCTFSSPTITNCTFHDNFATTAGGAIASSENHTAAPGKTVSKSAPLYTITVENCILWDNTDDEGEEIYSVNSATTGIRYSDVQGGQSSVFGNVTWGEGMIDADPRFVTGTLGDHFLSQTAAGQAVDSPCVDSGNPETPLPDRTTRTDIVFDSGVIDMGWHYEEPPEPAGPFLVAGPGPVESNPPLVRVFPPEEGAVHTAEFSAYGASSYGVNVATGDINGNGRDEIITGAGPGAIYGPHVRGFTPAGTAIPELNFLAYGTNKFGVNVVCGDLTGNGKDEIITGAGPGAVFGPHVRAFTNTGTAIEPMAGVSYFAYGTPKWGVHVAAGDIDGDGFDEILTGAGPGEIYGPHVRGWNVDGGTAAAIPGVSYFAYGTNKKGVRVACGDVDGDGIDEILTGPGPSRLFAAHIRGWNYDGGTLAEISAISFFAWPLSQCKYGATVSSGIDLNGDGWDEFIAGQGPDPAVGTVARVFTYDGLQTSWMFDLNAFGDSGLTHGVNVAAGSY